MKNKPYDPTLKALVETDPESWPALLGRPTGRTVAIDADIATVSGAADKVLRVSAKLPYLLHLEFVAGHDAATLPPKLHVRNGLLDDRHHLLVRSVVVLLRPEADSPRLTGVYTRGFPEEEEYLIFRYQVVRVWRLPPEQLLTGSLSLLPLAPISAVTKDELPAIIKRVEQRLRTPRGRRCAKEVWASAYLLAGLRYSPALSAELFRGVVSMKESSTYQAILKEGRAEGRAKGRTEGAVLEGRKLLRKLGERTFGPPDEGSTAAIEQINDLARLEEMFDRVSSATSWQELLSQPAAATRAERRKR